MTPSSWLPIVLDNQRLDLAVARGAAYYGMVRRGLGVRIAAGLARTYYIGVEQGAGAGSRENRYSLLPAPCSMPSASSPRASSRARTSISANGGSTCWSPSQSSSHFTCRARGSPTGPANWCPSIENK